MVRQLEPSVPSIEVIEETPPSPKRPSLLRVPSFNNGSHWDQEVRLKAITNLKLIDCLVFCSGSLIEAFRNVILCRVDIFALRVYDTP